MGTRRRHHHESNGGGGERLAKSKTIAAYLDEAACLQARRDVLADHDFAIFNNAMAGQYRATILCVDLEME